MVFSALTFSVSIPVGDQVFNWLATMYKGSIRLDTPMLYALAFLFLFSIGGLTGSSSVARHRRPPPRHLLRLAHFHSVMSGPSFAFLGGSTTGGEDGGRMYSEKLGRIAALLVFVGFT